MNDTRSATSTVAEIEAGVISTLRRCALGGSDRAVQTSDQLGELGLGLDSLSLVEFVTALENQYAIQFPDDFWVERGHLTLRDFIDVIVESDRSSEPSSPISRATIVEKFQVDEKPKTKREQIAVVTKAEGWLGGLYWIFKKLLGRIYRVDPKRFILAYDLKRNNIPQPNPDIDIELRIAGIDDEKVLSKIEVVQHDKVMSTKYFKERLDSGFICFVAYHNGSIIGVDWVSDQGKEEYVSTGLTFAMEKESCYALELYEDKRFLGKGVGLALLTYSLAVCRERGYARQITWVNADNVKMLSASVQLLGARKIGEFQVKRIFNKPYTRWTLEGKEGSGNIVRI
jgi:acyl carrier protein/GNAT superfamily N-acetyltransferase